MDVSHRHIRGAVVAMSSPNPDIRTRDGLAYLCGNLAEIRQTLDDDGTNPSTPLERLRSAIHGQRDNEILPLLDTVHTALQFAGDALGVYGHHGYHSRGPTGLDVAGSGGPLEITYRCPIKRCSGRERNEVSESSPHCVLADRKLERDRRP
ncbi:hypothetical protein ACFXHA_45490 [Nocardia sp. NPDC059240]|uniref:hypothetical protein n=1 Tax=Nocardia sp. NPDC059240 TaxID=3346786 RepID=UPI0036C5E0A5